MSRRLTDEARAFLRTAPDVTPAERLVLLAVADKAQDTDRPGWPARRCRIGPEDMAAEVGVKAASLGKVYLRLARRNLEVRVPLGKDLSRGRLIYSYVSAPVMFELPDFHGYRPSQ